MAKKAAPTTPALRRRHHHLGLALLGTAVVVAVALLGAATISYFADRDWRTIATVNGANISRAELRDRVRIVEALQALAALRLRQAEPAQASAIAMAFSGDPIEVARAQLIDEVLLRREANRRGVVPGEVDVGAELARAVNDPASVELRWVSLTTGGRRPDEVKAALQKAEGQLSSGSDPDVAEIARTTEAAWMASAGEAWISLGGPGHVDPDSPPPDITLAARGAAAGQILHPVDDGLGHAVVARVIAVKPGVTAAAALAGSAAIHGASDGALQAWAAGQALRRAVAGDLVATARTEPVPQVQLRELPLGPATPGAAMVELSALTLGRLGAGDAAARGQGIAADLMKLPPPQRGRTFRALVLEANAGGPPASTFRSGEIGWFVREDLLAPVGDVAFAANSRPGDLFGPINTTAGPQLFMLEGRYAGSLDERAAALAVEAREPGSDLVALAVRAVPRDTERAKGGPWRLIPEFAGSQLADSELPTADVGAILGPIDVAGEAVIGQLLGRRTAVPDGRQLAVVELAGLDQWIAAAVAQSTIVLSPDPLGVGTPSPRTQPPLESPESSRAEAHPSRQPPPFGLPTPFLPTPP
jgi:hypothetical protein